MDNKLSEQLDLYEFTDPKTNAKQEPNGLIQMPFGARCEILFDKSTYPTKIISTTFINPFDPAFLVVEKTRDGKKIQWQIPNTWTD